jgi:hypothetical protein
MGLLFLYGATLPLAVPAQVYLAGTLLAGLAAIRRKPSPRLRPALLLLGTCLSLRYLLWRANATIAYHDALSFTIASTLYLAEVFTLVVYYVGAFLGVRPIGGDTVLPVGEPSGWPTADVLVRARDESPDRIEKALTAATRLRYPKGRLSVYLSDEATTGREWRTEKLRAICRRLGAHYLARAPDERRAAGDGDRLRPRGDLALILEVDDEPSTDTLGGMVGAFQRDPGLSRCCLSAPLFWLFRSGRLAFLLAPAAYLLAPVAHLLLDVWIYDAGASSFLAYCAPHLIAAVIVGTGAGSHRSVAVARPPSAGAATVREEELIPVPQARLNPPAATRPALARAARRRRSQKPPLRCNRGRRRRADSRPRGIA